MCPRVHICAELRSCVSPLKCNRSPVVWSLQRASAGGLPRGQQTTRGGPGESRGEGESAPPGKAAPQGSPLGCHCPVTACRPNPPHLRLLKEAAIIIIIIIIIPGSRSYLSASVIIRRLDPCANSFRLIPTEKPAQRARGSCVRRSSACLSS